MRVAQLCRVFGVGLVLLMVPAVRAQTSPSRAGAGAVERPHTLMLRGDNLLASRRRVMEGDASLRSVVLQLRRDADKALRAPLIAVTDKRTMMPPSNDPHDYYSLSPYWWPDSSKADGLPYIRRDGVTNPESKRDLDQPRIAAMSDRVSTLALAWWFTGETKYADRAVTQLRTWFLDSATKMTPHLRYAQLVRGNDKERGSGIIDSRGLLDVVDAIALLEQSGVFAEADRRALRNWFASYQSWLLTSPNGRTERAAKNNHGSWYAAQTAAFALFSGDTAAARQIIGDVPARIASQIESDGRQPQELERTKSLHYSAFNLMALSRLAEMGRLVGVDVWTYRAPAGGSLTAAIDRMAPFVDRQQDWPDTQIDPVRSEYFLEVFRKARLALGDRKYDAVIARLPKADVAKDVSALLYAPDASRP